MPKFEVGQAAVYVCPRQFRPQRDPGAIARDGCGELAHSDVGIAEQEVIHEVL